MLSKKLVCLALMSAGLAGCSWTTETQGGGASGGRQSVVRDNASKVEVRERVQRWAEAFRRNDVGFVQTIVAPDFMLVSSANGKTEISRREEWLRRLGSFTHLEYSMRVVHVAIAGATAVATVEGHRKVRADDGNVRSFSFVATDTWVRQGGRWLVLSRHSNPVHEPASQ